MCERAFSFEWHVAIYIPGFSWYIICNGVMSCACSLYNFITDQFCKFSISVCVCFIIMRIDINNSEFSLERKAHFISSNLFYALTNFRFKGIVHK